MILAIDPLSALCFGKLLTQNAYLPVYIREIKAGLYDITPYFLSTVIVHGLSCVFYPFVVLSIGFWMWDYTDDSFNNYMNFGFPILILAQIGTLQGLLLGALFKDPQQALIVMLIIVMIEVIGIGNMVVHRSDNGW